MAENQPYVNILVGSSKGQKGPEVVLTPTTVLWPGTGLCFRRETHGNQQGLAELHSRLGPLMAFQVCGGHLSA